MNWSSCGDTYLWLLSYKNRGAFHKAARDLVICELPAISHIEILRVFLKALAVLLLNLQKLAMIAAAICVDNTEIDTKHRTHYPT